MNEDKEVGRMNLGSFGDDKNEMIAYIVIEGVLSGKSLNDIVNDLFNHSEEEKAILKDYYRKDLPQLNEEQLNTFIEMGFIAEKIGLLNVCLCIRPMMETEDRRKELANCFIEYANELRSLQGNLEVKEGGEE